MTVLSMEEFLEKECGDHNYELEDYEAEVPRWCKGCGDHGVLTSVQKLLRDRKINPEDVICVSGIGCSSRFPHYLKTYGFHGIHGRALTLSEGVALARPDLHLLTVMGDGDCFSIGGNHWIHALRYNFNATVIVLDNEIYGLTKKQASPTTRQGVVTNTTPKGAYLKSLNPLTLMLGVTNISFLAQTATWLPGHLDNTLNKAWDHKGLSFVRILQRCPAYLSSSFEATGPDFPAVFLEGEGGIAVDKGMLQKASVIQHDHHNLLEAQKVALTETPSPMGLIYYDPNVPTYGDIRRRRIKTLDRPGLIAGLNAELDKYTVKQQHG
ncbi:MAG: hypothetical protein A3I75_06210 [Deltaproteobacteria bacterium RIFCSPLOWO2_02_FULL_50_16]|nr:MAG: hypothetical protein A2053_03105 [Deltaproteobacteria bacterium GWA2_50_8]OGQ30878.1 MAG: hypothetical protein A3B79_01390 [Deltaproteobacteria bacterium RIFCSPHIGHO2_02_FULL_50_15]OGQ56538.1 MAG: hypothetical protein A3I75_06210 [Deltaproteobacteria bacterium RIFCSPLOWO2_02_FULL_50_16]OGQ65887.1 MAG: hypothetical protein A3F89_02540 [Deltaproteobacteria bacterium RIFCSPLOWO2_12_FULL_50_11]